MKANYKMMVEEILANHGATKANGVNSVEVNEFEKARKEIEAIGKFVIKTSKKEDGLYAIAYATKKSENLFIVKTFAEQKKAPKATHSGRIHMEMLNDRGLSNHMAMVEMTGVTYDVFRKFLENVVCLTAENDLVAQATIVETEDSDDKYTAKFQFPKIKGHSKDGFAEYKKLMTIAKRSAKEIA